MYMTAVTGQRKDMSSEVIFWSMLAQITLGRSPRAHVEMPAGFLSEVSDLLGQGSHYGTRIS